MAVSNSVEVMVRALVAEHATTVASLQAEITRLRSQAVPPSTTAPATSHTAESWATLATEIEKLGEVRSRLAAERNDAAVACMDEIDSLKRRLEAAERANASLKHELLETQQQLQHASAQAAQAEAAEARAVLLAAQVAALQQQAAAAAAAPLSPVVLNTLHRYSRTPTRDASPPAPQTLTPAASSVHAPHATLPFSAVASPRAGGVGVSAAPASSPFVGGAAPLPATPSSARSVTIDSMAATLRSVGT
ncbi:MAG: hypothetical protein EOO41_03945, partial [Methanobacteriota archaeon]